MKRNYFDIIKRTIVGSAMIVTTLIVLNSNTQQPSQLEGKWELDVRVTYQSFKDSVSDFSTKKNAVLEKRFGFNPIEISTGLFNAISIDRQVADSKIYQSIQINKSKASLAFRNIKRQDAIYDYNFFVNQLTIGESRFNIVYLDEDRMVLRAKSSEGALDLPIFYNKVK